MLKGIPVAVECMECLNKDVKEKKETDPKSSWVGGDDVITTSAKLLDN